MRNVEGGRALVVGANLECHLGARRELDAPIVRDVLLAEVERIRADNGRPTRFRVFDLLCQGQLDVPRKGNSVSWRDEAIAKLRDEALDSALEGRRQLPCSGVQVERGRLRVLGILARVLSVTARVLSAAGSIVVNVKQRGRLRGPRRLL